MRQRWVEHLIPHGRRKDSTGARVDEEVPRIKYSEVLRKETRDKEDEVQHELSSGESNSQVKLVSDGQ